MIGQVIKAIREFFYQKNFHEVVVPIFHTSLPLEPNLYAFKVGKYFLPTSPEATLKKAIARGIGNCFAIGHSFRDLEGSSVIHKPEFLMLEWYREKADYRKIMEECEELIFFIKNYILLSSPAERSDLYNNILEIASSGRHVWSRNDRKSRWPVISMENLFAKYAHLSLVEITSDTTIVGYNVINSKDKLVLFARKKGYKTKHFTWESLFNQIFLNEVVPHLPKEPFFLIDYPAKISPLCAKRSDKPYLAERFELYINGVEIANGNTENTDAREVLQAMRNEEKYRKRKGLICPPIDMEFIDALSKMQNKSYAGVGVGVERLAMMLGGIRDIGQLK